MPGCDAHGTRRRNSTATTGSPGSGQIAHNECGECEGSDLAVGSRGHDGPQVYREHRDEHDESLEYSDGQTMRLPNSGSDNRLGGRSMISESLGSASNTTEHAGSMMSSRNAMWIGNKTSGQP